MDHITPCHAAYLISHLRAEATYDHAPCHMLFPGKVRQLKVRRAAEYINEDGIRSYDRGSCHVADSLVTIRGNCANESAAIFKLPTYYTVYKKDMDNGPCVSR